MTNKDDQLLFNPNEKITLWVFLKNIFTFISASATDVLPMFFTFFLFRLTSQTEKTPIAGFVNSCFYFFFSFSMNYGEVQNTYAMPYFTKKNYRLFVIRTFRVAVINFVFFIISCGVIFLNKPVLELLNLKTEEIEEITGVLNYFIPMVGFFYTLTNFLRGSLFNLFFLIDLFNKMTSFW